MVSYHKSLLHTSPKRFGLEMDIFLEPKPGIPPSPSHLSLPVITKMKEEKARVIIVDRISTTKTAETIAPACGRSGGG